MAYVDAKSLIGMEQAELRLFEPPHSITGMHGGPIHRLELQYNPTTVTVRKGAQWQPTYNVAYARTPPMIYLGSEPRTVSFQTLIDGSGMDLVGVQSKVDILLSACQPTDASLTGNKPSPPWIRIDWGSFSQIDFDLVMTSVDVEYTRFSSSGRPLRATASLSMTEVPSTTSGQNPTSGALTARRVHTVVAGDSLQSLAFREYGEAAHWRAIAETNDIDDPLAVSPGTELLLPAAEELT